MKQIIFSFLTIILILYSSGCNSDSGTNGNIDQPGDNGEDPPPNGSAVSFSQGTQTLGNILTFGMVITDIDLDGDNDIFIADFTYPSRLWINDGDGNFTRLNQSFGTNITHAHDADIADLNGDSYPDIFLANHGTPSRFYINNGDNTFTLNNQEIGNVGDNPQTIQLTDVDGDGDNDALIYNISGPNRIWINDGSGSFTMRDIDYGGNDSKGQVLVDLNGDSFPDLFIALRSEPCQLWMNDGAGNFINSGQSLGPSSEAEAFGDIDGDSDVDILIGDYIWLNQNNTGEFINGTNLVTDDLWLRTELFDADLDGDLDILSSYLPEGNGLWLNDGTGTFSYHGTIFGTERACSIACGRLDGDEKNDVVIGFMRDIREITIYFNETIY